MLAEDAPPGFNHPDYLVHRYKKGLLFKALMAIRDPSSDSLQELMERACKWDQQSSMSICELDELYYEEHRAQPIAWDAYRPPARSSSRPNYGTHAYAPMSHVDQSDARKTYRPFSKPESMNLSVPRRQLLTREQSDELKAKGLCFFCRVGHHYSRDCQLRSEHKRLVLDLSAFIGRPCNSEERDELKAKGLCFFCRVGRHYTRDCQLRAEYKKRSQSVIEVGTNRSTQTSRMNKLKEAEQANKVDQDILPNTQNTQKKETLEKIKKLLTEMVPLDEAPVSTIDIPSITVMAPTPRFVVPFSLAGSTRKIPILLATGASESVIRRSFLVDLGLTHNIQECHPYRIHDGYAQTQLVRQKISISLCTPMWEDSVSFSVIDRLGEPAILGLPFLRKNAEFVDFAKLTFAETPCVRA